MLPDAQMWLSFSITIPLRSCLCMDAPPTSIAYFSTSRNPGVVLRVPATLPRQPFAAATACSCAQRVAIPEARARQFRAGLSPRRRHLAGPLTTAVTVTACGPAVVRSMHYFDDSCVFQPVIEIQSLKRSDYRSPNRPERSSPLCSPPQWTLL